MSVDKKTEKEILIKEMAQEMADMILPIYCHKSKEFKAVKKSIMEAFTAMSPEIFILTIQMQKSVENDYDYE